MKTPSIKLYSAAFELTTACPCRCATCGTDAGLRRADELTTDEWLVQVRAVASLGAQRLCLLGGEPFLHPGWSRIIQTGHELGLELDVISCGIGVTERLIETARACGLRWVTISIDGTEAVHDKLRRFPNGFNEALNALERFDRAGMKVGVTTQVNRQTLPTLEALAEQLETRGALGWQLQLTIPSGRARLFPELLLSPREIVEAFSVIRRLVKRRGLRPYITDNLGYMTRDEPELRTPPMCPTRCWMGCTAGLRGLGITSQGHVKGCLSLLEPETEGNVRLEPLERIWNDPTRFSYSRAFQPSNLGASCRDCGAAALCRGGCTSISVAATGKPNQGPYCARLQGVT